MNPNNNKNYFKVNKLVLGIVALVMIAGLLGWFLGRDSSPKSAQTNETQPSSTEVTDTGVKSLINYSLPDGWKEAACEAAPGTVYVIPAGADDINCAANPSTPVKLSVDPGNTKDCNELQNVNNVKKHVCVSLHINDHRSLKASTEYLASSSYGKETTINTYYIDVGSNVIKAEYVFNSDNRYEAGFDQLVQSIR